MPTCEACLNGFDEHGQGWEVAVVCGQPSRQLPDSLDRGELGTVGRQEYESQHLPVFREKRSQQLRMVVSGIVQDDDHPFPMGPMPEQQLGKKVLEGLGIEHFLHGMDELPRGQAYCPEASHRLPRGRMFQDRVLDLGGNPHPGASPVLLEVALVQTPDLGALNPLQPTEFF